MAAFNAATASARARADTLLIGRYGFLGSMFTGGNMTVLTTPSVGGIRKEIVDAIMAPGAARTTRRPILFSITARSAAHHQRHDIPSLWATGGAPGTAAALCAWYGVQPRILYPKEIQQVLPARGALVSPEGIAELEWATLTSGKKVKEFYEGMMADSRAYWRSRKERV